MTAFTTDIKVRFQHCDPAAIVFYPRYFEMMNTVIERWFETVLLYPFDEMHLEKYYSGAPLRRVDIDFLSPSRLGEVLRFTLTPRLLTRRSVGCSLKAEHKDETRLKGEFLLVHISRTTMRSAPWPEPVRPRFGIPLQDRKTGNPPSDAQKEVQS